MFAGVHALDYAYDRRDAQGLRFGDELARIGWKGDEPVGGRPMKAMFELHIEQGPILEAEGVDIGVVTHGQGLWWLQVTLTGKDSHTGSTPMAMRRNAGLGMARITELTHRVAMARQPAAVGAVGHVEVFPNSRNVIPGRVVFTVDIRSPDQATLDAMKAEIEAEAPKIAAELGLGIAIEAVGHFDPVTFDPGCVGAVRRAAERLGYSHRDIVSGAGHDACWINRVAPTAMVMCPCVDGLSHNEAEEITPDWAEKGANVLFHAVVETAEIVEWSRLDRPEVSPWSAYGMARLRPLRSAVARGIQEHKRESGSVCEQLRQSRSDPAIKEQSSKVVDHCADSSMRPTALRRLLTSARLQRSNVQQICMTSLTAGFLANCVMDRGRFRQQHIWKNADRYDRRQDGILE